MTLQTSTGPTLASGGRPSSKSSGPIAGTPSAASSGSSSASTCTLTGSPAFQQVKQTQASLARLSRVHQIQQQQQQQLSQINQSSHQTQVRESNNNNSNNNGSNNNSTSQNRSTTFVDCLIRRFKDCFSEDFCTVPMFVVGNLSPGSNGTHLILPPCVSLGRQNINRFASPKNLRLMNSIRDSCKSIEELDLGGNKLTDLIEVYKILQCTPNLKFLNLSENDLSRSSPVAMASQQTACTTTSYPNYYLNQPWSSMSPAGVHQQQRTCLGTLNQNNQQQPEIGARRHSSLGQSGADTSSSSTSRPPISRVAEARRLAAAAALAQSKKTSSSVASKLASSAAAAAAAGGRPTPGSRSTGSVGASVGASLTGRDKLMASRCSMGSQRHSSSTASTMHLARSLSSLSAKDIRAASTSLSRLSAQRSSVRKDNLRGTKSVEEPDKGASRPVTRIALRQTGTSKPSPVISNPSKSKQAVACKLFAEPIDEQTDDVDMNEQQVNNQLQQPPKALSSSIHTGPSAHTAPPRPTGYQVTSSSSSSTSNHRRTFESIKALALNNTGCQWRVVCSILSRMPNLEELHLSLNNYERIDLDPNERFKHYSLKRLYLCNNPKLTSWQELDKLLIAFPSLEALSIADCNISQIPDNLNQAREWQRLCGLNINGWPIKEWPVIERLNQLPSLIDLKCRNLEILSTIDEPRHHLIARLPKLQRLNGSEIEEREHAEKAFLRFFMANSHLERPRRFHELVQIHGEVTPVDVDVDLSPPSQARVRVIYLNRDQFSDEDPNDFMMSEDFIIKLMDNVDEPPTSDCMDEDQSKPTRLFKSEGQEVVAFDVDLRQSVRKFKSTLASIFNLSSQNLILYYIDHEMVGLMGPELIKHNQKKLWNYNVQDGDQFIVEER